MSRRRVVLTVAAVLLAAIVVTPLTVDVNSCRAPVEQWIVRAGAQHGIRLAFTEMKLSWGRIAAQKVELFAPLMKRFFVLFEANDVAVTPSWWSVVNLKPSFETRAKIYNGGLHAKISFDAISRDGMGNAQLESVQLAEHPQLAGLGIVAGTVHAQISDAVWQAGRITLANGTVTIVDVEKPHDTLVALEPFGLPFQTTLPAVRKLNGTIVFAVHKQAITFPTFEITSSLGKIIAPGSIKLSPKGEPERLAFDVTVSLSGDGKRAIGPYLPMISGGKLNETADRLNIRVSGTAKRPEFKVY